MGTRHLIIVQSDNQYKVAQYGQWDGYPGGQGVDILKFLHELEDRDYINPNSGFVAFKKEVDKTSFINNEQVLQLAKDKGFEGEDLDKVPQDIVNKIWDDYPYWSRDAGSNILTFIMDGTVTYLRNSIDFAKDGLSCEWAYLIDLDKSVFEVYTSGNANQPIGSEERFYSDGYKDSYGYYPVHLVASFPLSDLPSEEEFLAVFEEEEETE